MPKISLNNKNTMQYYDIMIPSLVFKTCAYSLFYLFKDVFSAPSGENKERGLGPNPDRISA